MHTYIYTCMSCMCSEMYVQYVRAGRKFAKSRAIPPRVVYVPTCPRGNVSKACQFLIFTCQHANKRTNLPKACQFFNLARRHANFLNWYANVPKGDKGRANFSTSLFLKKIIMKHCKFKKYLVNSRKFISRNKRFKFWDLQNLIKQMQN